MKDKLILGDKEFDSRFILGSGKYDPDLIKAAVENAGAQMITVALRRANTKDVANLLNYIPDKVTIIPQHIRSQKCPRSCKACKTGQGNGSRKLCQN